MRWRFWKRKTTWEIRPFDCVWNGSETSFIVHDGWEPFGVTPVPNTLNQNFIRLWTRRPEGARQKFGYEIKVQSAGWGGHQVLLHLTDGWEPFGASDSFGNHIIWFRKEVP